MLHITIYAIAYYYILLYITIYYCISSDDEKCDKLKYTWAELLIQT